MPGWMQTQMVLKAGWLALVGALVLAIAGFGAVQTIRLEGLKVWPLSIKGWKPRAQASERLVADIMIAQDLAEEMARSQRLAKEAEYRDIAERIDDNAQADLDGSLRAADRFIAAGGMRAEAGRSVRCSTGAPAGDHRAEDSSGTGRSTQLDAAPRAQPDTLAAQPEGLVLVTPADLRICTINTIKAEAGSALANQLQQASKQD